ncbi:MAG: cell division protein ZapB [Treponema sp.]|nr:cell division protein ZapB [Treponema sp.]
MNTLDQVLLLEQKVESAVEKIQQLQAENDALRSKCAELTNALSAKSEQLSSFETDSSRIETGIQKALDRLNSIENSILKTGSQVSTSTPPVNSTPTVQVVQDFNSMDTIDETQTNASKAPVESNVAAEEETLDSSDETMDDSIIEDEPMEDEAFGDEDPQDEDLGFDIF